jgi:hypothetical protein
MITATCGSLATKIPWLNLLPHATCHLPHGSLCQASRWAGSQQAVAVDHPASLPRGGYLQAEPVGWKFSRSWYRPGRAG